MKEPDTGGSDHSGSYPAAPMPPAEARELPESPRGTGRRRPGPGGRPPGPPAGRPAGPRDALVLALAGLGAFALALPPSTWDLRVLLPSAFILAVFAVWLALRSLSRARYVGGRAFSSVTALALGAVTVLLSGSTAISYVTIPQVREYNECLLGANTASARHDCDQLLQDVWNSRRVTGSAGPTSG